MTTDDLTERIARAIHEDQSNTPWEDRLSGDDQDLRHMAAAVLPIVEAEVRAAKAEALREAAKAYEAEGLDVNTESMPHHDGWSYVTVSQWLRIRATEYETGDQT